MNLKELIEKASQLPLMVEDCGENVYLINGDGTIASVGPCSREHDDEDRANAVLLTHAVNTLSKLEEALDRAVSIIEDIPYPGDYAAKELRSILAEANNPEMPQ